MSGNGRESRMDWVQAGKRHLREYLSEHKQRQEHREAREKHDEKVQEVLRTLSEIFCGGLEHEGRCAECEYQKKEIEQGRKTDECKRYRVRVDDIEDRVYVILGGVLVATVEYGEGWACGEKSIADISLHRTEGVLRYVRENPYEFGSELWEGYAKFLKKMEELGGERNKNEISIARNLLGVLKERKLEWESIM